MLYETKNIAGTISYFADIVNDDISLFFITTEREKNRETKLLTIEKIKKSFKKNTQRNMSYIHYPYRVGNKSDQINYAVRYLKTQIENHKNTYIAIYDVDSRPNAETFNIFRQEVEKYPYANVFQQSAIFLNNRNDFVIHDVGKYFLQIVAVAQTRFTLAHEIPRILRKIVSGSWFDQITYAHCVSHGLFIRYPFLEKVPMPSNYYPEDMFYGYLLSCIKEPIIPIYAFDNSNMPVDIKSLFIQRSKWFLGPFLSFTYLSYLKNNFRKEYNKNYFHAIMITLYSFFNAGEWICTTFVLLFILSMLFYGSILMIIGSILILISYMYSYIYIIFNIDILSHVGGRPIHKKSLIKNIGIVLGSPIYLVFHSLPAFKKMIEMAVQSKKTNL
ncbi:MAG: hypothetical protein WC875_04025 [Candidatus Absconditabacterales bacterium]